LVRKILHVAGAVAAIIATAVMAQQSGSATTKSDANKQICRTFGETGSRLNRYRACHTAQEWIELRRQTKQTIDHIQNARPWNTDPG
jgi:hypothetical protein